MTQIVSRGPVVRRFFNAYLHHTKGERAGQSFELEPWEQEFVDDFYRVDPISGRRLFRLGLLGIPRGNGKSPLAAGLGLYELVSRRDSPDIYCIAGAKDQAQTLLEYARAFVETGALLGEGLEPNKRSIVYQAVRGVMRVLSSAGSLQHSLNPSVVIGDELHALVTQAQEELWVAMWTALHKRPDSFALGITTAGYDKNTVLGRMYDAAMQMPDQEDRFGGCLRIRRDYENQVLCYWYGIPEQLAEDWDNEELWKLCNPASWITAEELRLQLAPASGLDEYDFMRLHLNMWTLARDSWLPAGTWPGLGEPDAEIPAGAEVYAGVDVGWKHDSTAVAIAWRRPDGRILVQARVWTTEPDKLGEHVRGGVMQLGLVEDHLRALARRYKLREINFDPNYFGRSAQDLEREGLAMVEMTPSSQPMREAWQAFYQSAREGVLVHDGDRVLATHVESAVAVKTEQGWKIKKLGGDKIDALSAAVMAHSGCLLRGSAKPAEPRIFWMDM